MKKLNNFENIITSILDTYKMIKIRFILIEDEYNNNNINKNKDDFLCQYIFFNVFSKYNNCILITNDKYRDKNEYLKLFKNLILKLNVISIKSNNVIYLPIDNNTIDKMLSYNCFRTNVPKKKMHTII